MKLSEKEIERHLQLMDAHYYFDVELTADCNRSCVFCPRQKIRRNQRCMTAKNRTRLVEWLPEECNVMFSGMGEPMSDRGIFEMVDKLASPRRIIGITSNGSLLDEAMTDRIVQSKLDFLLISLNSLDPKKYARMANGFDNHLIVDNIKHLLKCKRPEMTIQLSIIEDCLSENDRETLEQISEKYGIGIFLKKLHNRGGYLKDTPRGSFNTCYLFSQFTFIDSDGDVLSCCHDIAAKNIIGNIGRHSFDEVIQNKKNIVKRNLWFGECDICDDAGRANIV